MKISMTSSITNGQQQIICLRNNETRTIATANRSSVSIRVTKKLGRAGGVVEHVKIILSSSLITMQSLVAVCPTAWAHIGGAENAGVENAGVENAGSSRSQGWKMQEWKMQER